MRNFVVIFLQLAVTISSAFQKHSFITRKTVKPNISSSSSLQSAATTFDNLQGTYDNVFKWAKEKGFFVSEKIKPVVRDVIDGGTGVFAMESVKENEVIIYLPSSGDEDGGMGGGARIDTEVMLDYIPDSDAKTRLKKLHETGQKDQRMAALVGTVAQMQLLRASSSVVSDEEDSNGNVKLSMAESINLKFGPALDILSATSLETHMLFWSSQEITELLAGTIAHSKAIAMRFAANQIFNYLRPSFLTLGENFTSLDTSSGLTSEHIDSILKESFACLTSRGFTTDQGYIMLPVIDLINHTTEPNVNLLISDSGTATLRASRDIQEGEELYLDYGSRPSWDFGVEYGFCPSILKIDSVALPILPSSKTATDESVQSMIQMITAAVKNVTGKEPDIIQLHQPILQHNGGDDDVCIYHHCVIFSEDSTMEDLLPIFAAASFVEKSVSNQQTISLEEVQEAITSRQHVDLDSIKGKVMARKESLMEAHIIEGDSTRAYVSKSLRQAELQTLDKILVLLIK